MKKGITQTTMVPLPAIWKESGLSLVALLVVTIISIIIIIIIHVVPIKHHSTIANNRRSPKLFVLLPYCQAPELPSSSSI